MAWEGTTRWIWYTLSPRYSKSKTLGRQQPVTSAKHYVSALRFYYYCEIQQNQSPATYLMTSKFLLSRVLYIQHNLSFFELHTLSKTCVTNVHNICAPLWVKVKNVVVIPGFWPTVHQEYMQQWWNLHNTVCCHNIFIHFMVPCILGRKKGMERRVVAPKKKPWRQMGLLFYFLLVDNVCCQQQQKQMMEK